MADAPAHRHNGGPLNEDDQRKLWNHIRALETLEEQKAEVAEDIKCRKEIVKADGFDTNIVGIILKRRKAGKGQTSAADSLLQLYEEALQEQGALPLEETKRPKESEERRTPEQIAEDLHGPQALSGDELEPVPPTKSLN